GAATPHPLHQLAHLLVVLHEAVDVLHLSAGPLGDAPATAGIQYSRVGALLLRHARDDRLYAADLLLVDLGAGRQQLACARDHLEYVTERADLLELAHLREHVLEREVAEIAHLALVIV